jgi:hypothetical protein
VFDATTPPPNQSKQAIPYGSKLESLDLSKTIRSKLASLDLSKTIRSKLGFYGTHSDLTFGYDRGRRRSGTVLEMPCHRITVGDRDLDLPEPCNLQDEVPPQPVPKLDLCPGLDI